MSYALAAGTAQFVRYKGWSNFLQPEVVEDSDSDDDFHDATEAPEDYVEFSAEGSTEGPSDLSDLPEDLLVTLIWPMVLSYDGNFSLLAQRMSTIQSVCRSWRVGAESTTDFRDY